MTADEAVAAQVLDLSTDSVSAAEVLAAAEYAYARGRRDTPTGVVIGRLDPQTDRALWLALRRTGIGSSDMGAVLGMSKYRSELDVFLDKTGAERDDDAGEAAFWGTVLEDPVAREWARRHDVTVRRIGTIAHVEHRHMLCDLDRYVVGCPDHERCALEVKTRSAWKADEWRDGGLPEDVEAQTMHQLAVTGLDAIHVAGLVGGQRLESRVVLPDPDYIADLFKIGDQFWNENVLPGNPPAISSLDLLVEHLNHFTPSKGVPADLTEAEEHEVRHLSRIIAEAARAKAAGDEAEKKLKALIGDGATDIELPGPDGKPVTWWSWRSQARPRTLDQDAVARDLGVPDLNAYKTSAGTMRVLRKGGPVKDMVGDDDTP